MQLFSPFISSTDHIWIWDGFFADNFNNDSKKLVPQPAIKGKLPSLKMPLCA
jgi:hypothetical protein